MATTTQYPPLRSMQIAVPITSALFGFLGLGGGLFTFLSPRRDAATMFGILPPTTLSSKSEADGRQRAYIQIHGIRNIAGGLNLIALTSFWRFSTICQSSPAAANAVQKAMAILLGIGVIVGVGDGLLLRNYLESDGLSGEAKELAASKSKGHFGIMVPVLALAAGWWYLWRGSSIGWMKSSRWKVWWRHEYISTPVLVS